MIPRNQFFASVAGTILVAVCCFTPLLVIALAATELAAFTPYLDLFLLPALAVLVVVTWVSYTRYARSTART